MSKVLIIGFLRFATNDLTGGQEIKTRTYFDHLVEKYGRENVIALDTERWKHTPFRFFLRTIKSIRKAECILLMPSSGGIKIFPTLISLFKRKRVPVIYSVIGGWLPALLSKKKSLLKKVGRFNRVLVETNAMKEGLVRLGLENVEVIPNSRSIAPFEFHPQEPKEPIKVCTFSRIASDKGIEEAIEAVALANKAAGRRAFQLTLFGQVTPSYIERFEEVRKSLPEEVTYGGIVPAGDSIKTLHQFDILVFLSRRIVSEGFPGTILDGYFSGLAIIASDTPNVREVVINGENGFLVSPGNSKEAAEALVALCATQGLLFEIKRRNLEKSRGYMHEETMRKFDKILDECLAKGGE